MRHFSLTIDRKRSLPVTLLVLLICGGASAQKPSPAKGTSPDCDAACQRALSEARAATAKYHRVEEAIADGYVSTQQCVSSPFGGMGIH